MCVCSADSMYLPPILGYLSLILGRMFVAKSHGVNRLMLFHSWANQSNTYTVGQALSLRSMMVLSIEMIHFPEYDGPFSLQMMNKRWRHTFCNGCSSGLHGLRFLMPVTKWDEQLGIVNTQSGGARANFKEPSTRCKIS